MSGFKGRSGRSFSAKLRLDHGEDGKWRVEFDEEWANQQPAADRTGASAREAAPVGE